MEINCCKDCESRELGCHSICIDYLIAKEKNDKFNKEKHEYLNTNQWTDKYIQYKRDVLNRRKRGVK